MFGAGDSVAATPAPKKEGKRMSRLEEFFRTLMGEGGADDGENPPAPVAAMAAGDDPKPAPVQDEAQARMASDLAAARAENQRLRTAAITREAVLFADEQIRDGRAMPSEREAIIDAFTQASIDDGVIGAVSFADGRTTSRVEIIKRQYKDRQSVKKLFEEYVGDDVLMALHQRSQPKTGEEAPTDAEVSKLVGMTAFGRAATNGASKN
jgi:hypothetical protein